ncbi:hypothetical protein LX36DRAFT_289250 [Colletotrichum falcatum]|nr:hypothetical protein LX36DRAFT_289250 [Colletotrichum falcatum]
MRDASRSSSVTLYPHPRTRIPVWDLGLGTRTKSGRPLGNGHSLFLLPVLPPTGCRSRRLGSTLAARRVVELRPFSLLRVGGSQCVETHTHNCRSGSPIRKAGDYNLLPLLHCILPQHAFAKQTSILRTYALPTSTASRPCMTTSLAGERHILTQAASMWCIPIRPDHGSTAIETCWVTNGKSQDVNQLPLRTELTAPGLPPTTP